MSLRVYGVLEELLRDVGPLLRRVARVDFDLARQGRRAGASGLLNLAEGMHSRRGNRRLRYENAAGSVAELRAVMHVASAWGYIQYDRGRFEPRFAEVIGTLVKLVERAKT